MTATQYNIWVEETDITHFDSIIESFTNKSTCVEMLVSNVLAQYTILLTEEELLLLRLSYKNFHTIHADNDPNHIILILSNDDNA